MTASVLLNVIDKPFGDERRVRHDESNPRSGGHTMRRVCQCRQCWQHSSCHSTLTRSENAITRAHSYLDAGKEYGMPLTSTLAAPYKLTDFELEGLDSSNSLGRNRAWEEVPATLEELSVGMPSVRKLKDGRLETCYNLQPTALILPDPAVAAAEARLATHIHEIRRQKPALWAQVATEPPDGVNKPMLKAVLQCDGCRVPQTAIVRCNQPGAFWDVGKAHGKPLTLDLGSTCLISSISTQGRHPATRRYPRVQKDAQTQQWEVEDAEHLPAYTTNTEYKGPWFTVRSTPNDNPPTIANTTHEHPYHGPAWVSRFELLWRADGGRKWHSLGVCIGNTDELTEVAHSFTALRGDLHARYLRIKPLECEGGGAMRVGVYGQRTTDVRDGVHRSGHSSHAVGGEGDGLIQYKLVTALPAPNRYKKDGVWGTGPSKWRDINSSANRRNRRLAATRAASAYHDELEAGWWDVRGRAVGGRAVGELDEGASEDEELAPGAATRRMPWMSRVEAGLAAREREELDLALAISASLVDTERKGAICTADACGDAVACSLLEPHTSTHHAEVDAHSSAEAGEVEGAPAVGTINMQLTDGEQNAGRIEQRLSMSEESVSEASMFGSEASDDWVFPDCPCMDSEDEW